MSLHCCSASMAACLRAQSIQRSALKPEHQILSPVLCPAKFEQAALSACMQAREKKVRREMDVRNKYLSDADLDAALPGEADGYAIVPPPATYRPIRTPARKLAGAPDAVGATPGMTPGYVIPAENQVGGEGYGITKSLEGLPDLREEDMEHFGSLLQARSLICVSFAVCRHKTLPGCDCLDVHAICMSSASHI